MKNYLMISLKGLIALSVLVIAMLIALELEIRGPCRHK